MHNNFYIWYCSLYKVYLRVKTQWDFRRKQLRSDYRKTTGSSVSLWSSRFAAMTCCSFYLQSWRWHFSIENRVYSTVALRVETQQHFRKHNNIRGILLESSVPLRSSQSTVSTCYLFTLWLWRCQYLVGYITPWTTFLEWPDLKTATCQGTRLLPCLTKQRLKQRPFYFPKTFYNWNGIVKQKSKTKTFRFLTKGKN